MVWSFCLRYILRLKRIAYWGRRYASIAPCPLIDATGAGQRSTTSPLVTDLCLCATRQVEVEMGIT